MKWEYPLWRITEGYPLKAGQILIDDEVVQTYPDNDGTGGYYLLFSKDFSNTQSEGYDEWYPNLDELSNRFSDFNIDWQNWIQG